MATATILNQQVTLNPMASRRVPLSNNPNAVNSPYHGTAAKRLRASASELKEGERELSPPKKKQAVEITINGTRRAQAVNIDNREGKIPAGRHEPALTNVQPKRLLTAPKQPPAKDAEKTQNGPNEVEIVKQWRRHYKKVFPNFIFFLEGLPDDARLRFSRQISALGAKEEVFFSKSVTHIVTGKPIPSKADDSASRPSKSQPHSTQARTINPSLLEKSAVSQNAANHARLKIAVEQPAMKRDDARQQQRGASDVLKRAMEMDIKIWSMEKFERMMDAMFDEELARPAEIQTSRRTTAVSKTQPKQPSAAELSQMIKNEKEQVPQRSLWSDIIPLRGVYIYSHDIDEKTKPIMVREYATPLENEDGEWPQFKSVPLPRCPFLEDPQYAEQAKRDKERARCRTHRAGQQPRTRAASAALEAAKVKTEEVDTGVLQNNTNCASRTVEKTETDIEVTSVPFEPPKSKPSQGVNTDSMPPHMSTARFNFQSLNRNPAREPTASGLQQANVTSAIKSQMISSTAAAPGGRAGTSKEMHQLQRRAVERQGRLSVNSNSSSYLNEVRTAINNAPANAAPPPRRATRKKNVTQMTKIHEDEHNPEDEAEDQAVPEAAKESKKRTPPKREPKPGYCENCRDKYDDFYEHVESRKHKKFALADENWKELDALLAKLRRK